MSLCRPVSGNHWEVDQSLLDPGERGAFQSLDTLLRSPLEQVTLDTRSGVATLHLQSTYYVKTFKGDGSRVRHSLGTSRYQRERRNLVYFRALGLQTPDLVAHGQESCFGLLRRAVLVTAEVKNASNLEQVARSGELYRYGAPGARRILAQLARAVRLLHTDGFYHRDLKPRNILVRQSDSKAGLFFFDCPAGHHPLPFLRHRGIVRDIAHLKRGLQAHVRQVDLLYLYKQYRDCIKLTAQDKQLATEALSYYAQRRMTRKRRLRAKRKRNRATQ